MENFFTTENIIIVGAIILLTAGIIAAFGAKKMLYRSVEKMFITARNNPQELDGLISSEVKPEEKERMIKELANISEIKKIKMESREKKDENNYAYVFNYFVIGTDQNEHNYRISLAVPYYNNIKGKFLDFNKPQLYKLEKIS